MKLRYLLGAATCLVLPVAAHAQPITGPYVSLGAGYNIPFDKKLKVSAPEASGSVNADFTGGVAAIGGAGYGFGNGFRVELDANYLHQNSNKITEDGESARIPGTLNQFGILVNGLYDFSLGWPVQPYVGAGVGAEFISYRSNLLDESFSGEGISSTRPTSVNPAIDAIIGIAYPIQAVPGLALTAQYTFLAAFGTADVYKASDNFGDSEKIGFNNNYTNIVTIGMRYAFDAAPPAPVMAAPAAAPAPAPAKTYLVFFDWDKYNLTPRATQIIAQAASDSHTQQVTTINVSGYTDTSGTAQYNQGLSQRRAQAVASQLVADGVSKSEISIHAYGDTHLLVPTGPGVREPQNRRVEIVLD